MSKKKQFYILSILLLPFFVNAAAKKTKKDQLRCGWYENPSPSHAWLKDKSDRWMIIEQGVHEAKGSWAPAFDKKNRKKYVNLGAGFGYGCVCMKAQVDLNNKRFNKVSSIKIKDLKDCRNDPALTEPRS